METLMKMKWKIGSVEIENPFILAPMAGVTDLPFRILCKEQGAGLLCTEMVSAKAISFHNKNTISLMQIDPVEHPVSMQIFGSEPDLMAEVAKSIEEQPFDILDINMGCPVKKIVNNKSGSYLMKDLKLASEIIETAVKSTKLKVSVKFRKGWDMNSVNAVEFARMCEDSGAAYLTVHGRTRSAFYSGEADWDIICRVKQTVKIPVIGNGDIATPYDAERMIKETGVDGVMIGRACLGNPWLISQTHRYLNERIEPQPIPVSEIKAFLLKHIQELSAYYGQDMGLAISRKFVCWYCKNLRDAKRFREIYTKLNDYDAAMKAIDEYFDSFAGEER